MFGTDELDDDDWREQKGRIPYLPDLHLRSPIRRSERNLLDHIKDHVLEHGTPPRQVEINCPPAILNAYHSFIRGVDLLEKKFRSQKKSFPRTFECINEHLYGSLLGKYPFKLVGKLEEKRVSRHKEGLQNMSTIIAPVLEAATGVADLEQATVKTKQWQSILDTLQLPTEWSNYSRGALGWTTIRDSMAKAISSDKEQNLVQMPFEGWIGIISKRFFFYFDDKQDKWYTFDYDQVVMICDAILSREMSLFCSTVYRELNLDYLPPSSLISSIFTWGDNLLELYGNEAYDKIKILEPLTTALLIHDTEHLDQCKQYFMALTSNAHQKGFGDKVDELVALIRSYNLTPNQCFEISGLFRIFGHPTIDEQQGMMNQHEQVTEKIEINKDCVAEATGGLIRLIVLEYINRNRRWPRCHIRPGSTVSESFKSMVEGRATIIDERISGIKLSEWASIEFEKNDDYDDIKDFTTLLDDKSCSLPRDKYHLSYSSYRTYDLGVKLAGESRRLLTEVLRTENFDPVKIRETIQSRKIPLMWLIVGLCSKERELKVCGRLFTILAAPIRFFFGVTQKNVADRIMPYVSAQTMTLSDSQLVNRLYSNTSNTERKTMFKITLSLDFEKFNQRWRREAVEGATRFLDEWFGTKNVFSFVHDFFDHAFFYLCSQFEPPDHLRKPFLKKMEKMKPELKDLFLKTATTWNGQLGAGEGLFQKVWTIIVNGALHAVECITTIHSSIMGQGDNQVIVISWPINHPDMDAEQYALNYQSEITYNLNRYTTELTRIMNGLGMKIKLEETWMSTKFLSYGKEPFYNGVYMSITLKKLIRMYLEVNDVHPTAANRLGAVMSAAYSASSKDHNQVVPYLLGIYESTKLLVDELSNGPINGDKPALELKKRKIRPDRLVILSSLILSKEFGGFPIIPFPEYLYRGHNDPVTSSLEWVYICSKHIPQLEPLKTWISSKDGINKDKDFERLILDPTCLNFKIAAQYSGQVATILEQGLRSKVTNAQLRKLFSMSTTTYKDALFKYLTTVEPCFPRALNEIVRISPVGAMLAVLAQFRNIKTIKELLPFHEGIRLVDLIKAQDVQMIVGTVILLDKILRSNKYVYPSETLLDKRQRDWNCRSQLAHSLRKESWGRAVEGSTVPHPLEQFQLINHKDSPCDHPNPEHLVCSLLPLISSSEENRIVKSESRQFARGPLPVYSGSTTREKKTTGLITFQKSDHGAKAAARALHLKFWIADQDGTLASLLDSVAESRCNITPKIMEGMIGEHYGGSATHRLHCVAVKYTQAPNTRPNFTTWGLLSSDPMGKYARGLENYTILFQGAFLTAFAQLSNREVLGIAKPDFTQETYHYHINCLTCCQPIYDARLHSTTAIPKMPDVSSCTLLYSNVESLIEQQDWFVRSKAKWIRPVDHPELREEHTASAVASILLGSHQQANALSLLSNIKKPEQVRHDPTISIGCVMRIGLPAILKEVSRAWFCSVIPDVSAHALGQQSSIRSTIRHILLRTSFGVWDSIKPIMLIPEVREEIVKHYKILPSNVNAFFSGKGLDQLLGGILCIHIDQMMDRGEFTPSILCPARNFPVNALLKIWSNSVIMGAFYGSDEELHQALMEWQHEFDSLWGGGTFDPLRWQFLWKRFCIKYNLGCAKGDATWPPLSAMSAEGWLRPEVLPFYAPEPTVPLPLPLVRPEDVKTLVNCQPIYEYRVLIESNERTNLYESLKYNSLRFEDLGEKGDIGAKPEFLTREDHFYRIHGPYSTAQYKYLECYLRSGIEACEKSLHLAEGAGGVAFATHRLYGTSWIGYNSLVDASEGASHRFINFRPAALINVPKTVTIEGPKFCVETGGDICSPSSVKYYQRLVVDNPEIGIITCDAETSGEFQTTIAIQIIDSVLEICKLASCSTLVVMKAFCHMPSLLAYFICLSKSVLFDVRLIVPVFSSNESYEVFIIGKVREDAKTRKSLDVSGDDSVLNHIINIEHLTSTRISSEPHQFSHRLETEFFWEVCDRLDIPLNYQLALQTISGSFYVPGQEETWNEMCRDIQATILVGIITKMKAIGKQRPKQARSAIWKELITKKTKLSLEFARLADAHFNISNLIYLQYGLQLTSTAWTSSYIIRHETEDLWLNNPNYAVWSQHYLKHWNKLRGWITFMVGIEQLPMFLNLNFHEVDSKMFEPFCV